MLLENLEKFKNEIAKNSGEAITKNVDATENIMSKLRSQKELLQGYNKIMGEFSLAMEGFSPPTNQYLETVVESAEVRRTKNKMVTANNTFNIKALVNAFSDTSYLRYGNDEDSKA